jgi:hypothetical protein
MLDKYKDPKTTKKDINDLHNLLVQTCIDFINERELFDIDEVNFTLDGLQDDVKYGEWTPGMDSSVSIIGLQEEGTWTDRKGNVHPMIVRRLIGDSM